MTTNHQEESLKALRQAEAERIWFSDEASDEELLQAYKSLDMDSTVKNYLLELLEHQEEKIKNELQDDLFKNELQVISNCFDFLNNKAYKSLDVKEEDL